MRHTPLGYEMRRGKIVIIEKRADTVRWIFDSYIHGVSQKSIARQLKDKKVPTATGKYEWSQCSVRSILTNQKYMGDDYHPRIIEPYIFECAQTRREEKNKVVNAHPKIAHLQPLSGKCKCGKCGGVYHYVKGDWRCSNYIKDNKVSCKNDVYSDKGLIEAIIDVFLYLKENPKLIVSEPEIQEKKTSVQVNALKIKIRNTLKNEDLSYPEFRELIYRKAQERYRVSPIWDRDYQNNKLQNFLKFNDMDLNTIKEITDLIKQIELYSEGVIILTLGNDLRIQHKVVLKKC